MPRKKKVLPDEIQLIVDEVKKKQQEEDTNNANLRDTLIANAKTKYEDAVEKAEKLYNCKNRS